ncbi:hypothetical protein BDR06DRAFT_954333 [Suillus hirtellus]|nr:hypothetical protein BDR06DRAFT_954333 [Suillus hirtellus]
MPYVKNLSFQTKDLGKKSTLLLTFDSSVKGLYQTCFPTVCWLTTFGQTGSYRICVTYSSQLAFSRPQLKNGNIIDAETCVELNDGEKTTLTRDGSVFQFSNPVKGVPGYLEALNDSGSIQDIALGFKNPRDSMPTPVLYFKEVEDASKIVAEFTPILRAYVTAEYQHTTILQEAIEIPAIWEQNIASLSESTTWNLTRDTATGRYNLTQADEGTLNSSIKPTVVGA